VSAKWQERAVELDKGLQIEKIKKRTYVQRLSRATGLITSLLAINVVLLEIRQPDSDFDQKLP
jgi:hypothetical protein